MAGFLSGLVDAAGPADVSIGAAARVCHRLRLGRGMIARVAVEGRVCAVRMLRSWGAWRDLKFAVAPLTAGMLVVVAVSPMGAGRPIDCASFTTSLVACSAITVSETVVAQDSLSDSCAELGKDDGVSGDECCECCEPRPVERPCSAIRDAGTRKSRAST